MDAYNSYTNTDTIFTVEKYLKLRGEAVKFSSTPLIQALIILKLSESDHYNNYY